MDHQINVMKAIKAPSMVCQILSSATSTEGSVAKW